jgi:hypothetical protein
MPVKKRLKRIAPLQLGVVAGVFYALFSLIFIPFFLLMALAGAFAPKSDSGSDLAAGVGIVFGFFLLLLAPIMYGILGFIFGALGALVYNLVAKWTGGVEVEVEDLPAELPYPGQPVPQPGVPNPPRPPQQIG